LQSEHADNDIHTVFIIGAGLSAEYGFPLGTDLFAELRRLCGSPSADPFHRRIQEACGGIALKGMQRALEWTEADTVDEFLVENAPDMRKLVKTAMADILLERERLFSMSAVRDHKQTSYHILWNKFIREPRSAARARIITFNYDRSLEFYFYRKAADATVRLGAAPSLDRSPVQVLHVHGALGDCRPEGDWWHDLLPFYSAPITAAAARNVCVYSEPEAAARFGAAREWIERAKRVVFLGFGFHESNLQNLGLIGPGAVPPRSGRCTTTTVALSDERVVWLKQRIDPNLGSLGPDVGCRAFLEQLPAIPSL
jgi:hypothetical protein